jgi:hypothetical protein
MRPVPILLLLAVTACAGSCDGEIFLGPGNIENWFVLN